MKKAVFTLILLTVCSYFSSAQTITGVVIDGEFNDPLPFANIVVEGQTIGTTSDFDGKYSLQ